MVKFLYQYALRRVDPSPKAVSEEATQAPVAAHKGSTKQTQWVKEENHMKMGWKIRRRDELQERV